MANERTPLDIHENHLVNFHLGEVMSNLIDIHPPFADKRELTSRIVHKHNQSLSRAMDSLSQFSNAIEDAKAHYAQMLNHPELTLEHKVKLGDLCEQHILMLRDLHTQQKDAIKDIAKLFLALSKKHLKQRKKEQ